MRILHGTTSRDETGSTVGVPLAVDLDGTFLRGDSLRRMAIALALRKPHRLPAALRQLRRGRNHLKLYLWHTVPLDTERARVNTALLAWLRAEAKTGRKIHLATGAPQALAEAVAAAYPFFGTSFGTSEHTNLTGMRKAAVLVENFGEAGFDYVGNARADLAVWRHARAAVVCNASPRLLRQVGREVTAVGPIFPRRVWG